MKGSFHIGDWEVQPQINCVQKGNESHHLEPKIMQVLLQLAAHSNEVLTKDELIRTVWADTFVTEDVLTRSISEIRRVLEDDARAPKFIQTIPKTGYRLIVPVAVDPTPSNATADVVPHAPAVPPGSSSAAEKLGASRKFLWIVLPLTGLLVVGALLWATLRGKSPVIPPNYKTVPLTSYLGTEMQPAFSPDGNQVAFVWKDENSDHQHVYVKLLGTETPLKITTDAADDYAPTWSPDGRSIAFLRVSETDRGIYVVPAIGGAARKIYNPLGTIEWDRGSLSWSPDGTHLIFPDGKSGGSPSSIYSLRMDRMQAVRITNPPSRSDGDSVPALSPDGKKFAFVRGADAAVRDIFLADPDGRNLHQLTFDRRFVSGIAWTADSTSLIFSSDRGGKFSLWRIPINGGDPVRLPVGGEDAFTPAIAAQGNRLAYAQRSAKWSITRVDLKSASPKDASRRLLSSTQQDSFAHFSPDSQRIAFQSLRSGTQEIWLASINGNNLVKLTSFDGPLTGSPSWSPDGRKLAFDSRPKGFSHIYTIQVEGGIPSAITEGNFNDIVPSWSQDGRWIYFGSNRTGTWQIWKVPSVGGEAKQVTAKGGFIAVESPDGKSVYYAKADAAGIWQVPVEGGPETQVLKQPDVGQWANWAVSSSGIFFLDSSVSPALINFYNFNSRQISRLHQLEPIRSTLSSLAASPDGRYLLFSDLAEAGSRITLVENFR